MKKAKTKQENLKTNNTTAKLTKILKLYFQTSLMPSSEIQARHFISNTNSMVTASTSQTTQMLYKACFVTIVLVGFFLLKIGQDTFFKLEHSQQHPETPLGHFFGGNSTELDVLLQH